MAERMLELLPPTPPSPVLTNPDARRVWVRRYTRAARALLDYHAPAAEPDRSAYLRDVLEALEARVLTLLDRQVPA